MIQFRDFKTGVASAAEFLSNLKFTFLGSPELLDLFIYFFGHVALDRKHHRDTLFTAFGYAFASSLKTY